MENSQDQPPPPGVHSWPYHSLNSSQTLQYQFPPNAPPHIFGSNHVSSNTPYYNSQQGAFSQPGFITGQAHITSHAPPTVQSTSSNRFDGANHNAENSTSVSHQDSGANFAWKGDDAASNVSNTSMNYSVVQLNNARGIDATAQDAVLREQVCIDCVYVFLFHCFSLNPADCFGFVFTDRKLLPKISYGVKGTNCFFRWSTLLVLE